MADYISREAAEEIFACGKEDWKDYEAAACIAALPSADVAPVRHGEWFVSIGKDGKPVGTICPICGFAWAEAIDAVKLNPALSLIETPYCPNCGAKMDGGET